MERRGILAAVMEGHMCAVLGAEDDKAAAAEFADTGQALTQAGSSEPVVR